MFFKTKNKNEFWIFNKSLGGCNLYIYVVIFNDSVS